MANRYRLLALVLLLSFFTGAATAEEKPLFELGVIGGAAICRIIRRRDKTISMASRCRFQFIAASSSAPTAGDCAAGCTTVLISN